jgi:hypothetical protein
VRAQFLAQQADKLAAIGRGHLPPGEKGLLRPLERLSSLSRIVLAYVGDDLAGYGCADGKRSALISARGHPKAGEQSLDFACQH